MVTGHVALRRSLRRRVASSRESPQFTVQLSSASRCDGRRNAESNQTKGRSAQQIVTAAIGGGPEPGRSVEAPREVRTSDPRLARGVVTNHIGSTVVVVGVADQQARLAAQTPAHREYQSVPSKPVTRKKIARAARVLAVAIGKVDVSHRDAWGKIFTGV